MSLWHSVKEFIAQPLRETREEQLRYLQSREGAQPDWNVMVMLVAVAALLTLQNYYVSSGNGPIEMPIRRWIEVQFSKIEALRYNDH